MAERSSLLPTSRVLSQASLEAMMVRLRQSIDSSIVLEPRYIWVPAPLRREMIKLLFYRGGQARRKGARGRKTALMWRIK